MEGEIVRFHEFANLKKVATQVNIEVGDTVSLRIWTSTVVPPRRQLMTARRCLCGHRNHQRVPPRYGSARREPTLSV